MSILNDRMLVTIRTASGALNLLSPAGVNQRHVERMILDAGASDRGSLAETLKARGFLAFSEAMTVDLRDHAGAVTAIHGASA